MPRFTPEFLDELKSRLRPSDVIGRHVKLKKQGNEWAGLSPFTKEKTPSFFVNDQKGFYHCFSSGKHGDIIAFLQETQNLQFHEAVAQLAEDAGLELPKDDPREAKREEERKGLVEVCEAAAHYFEVMLTREPGRAAMGYLREREVTPAQIKQFRIGYAPSARGNGSRGGGQESLKVYLIQKGFHEDIIAEAGLLTKPDDGKPSFDKFRDRVMFPITNPRGQVIAFGGRALSREVRAKYLNSPETPLFHKGANLYRYREARSASVQEKAPLIVCEGYMDVVALWGAGIGRAVAPLGTAMTEQQLAMLWRASDEPLLCFDGDKAGIAAAYRAVDRALPMIKPGKSLNFIFLPDGQDPDDLLRAKGRTGFDEVVADAKPLVDVVWQRERDAMDLSTPERRASFRTRLRNLVKIIGDKDVQNAYGRELAIRLDEMFGGSANSSANNGQTFERKAYSGNFESKKNPFFKKGHARSGGGYPVRMSPELRAFRERTKSRGGSRASYAREATLLLALIHHPELFDRREAEILDLNLTEKDLSILLNDLLDVFSTNPGLDSVGLKRHLGSKASGNTLERLLQDRALNSQKFLQAETQVDEVDWGFDNVLGHHLYQTDLKEELTRSSARLFTRPGTVDGNQADGNQVDGDQNEDGDLHDDALRAHDDPNVEKDTANIGYWKATASAREDLYNRNRVTSHASTQNEDSAHRLEEVLKNLGSSVASAAKKRTR